MEPCPIAYRLCSDGDLSISQLQEFKDLRTRPLKVDFLLSKIMRSRKEDIFVRILSYLEEKDVQQGHISARLADKQHKLPGTSLF